LPERGRGLVIIDESHHFRHPRTARYHHVARGRWSMKPSPAAQELSARLQEHIVAAVRRRDSSGLRRLDQILRFLSEGHTAGEEMLIAHAARAPAAELMATVGRLPAPRPIVDNLEVQLVGLVLFAPSP
jgi:hypothetical protein